MRADGAWGRRSWGPKRGFEYRDGRTRVFEQGTRQVQPDEGFEQWGNVLSVGLFVVANERFGPGILWEIAGEPRDGRKDEDNEHVGLLTPAVSFVQPFAGGLELSLLWNGTPDGSGRIRATVVWKIPEGSS